MTAHTLLRCVRPQLLLRVYAQRPCLRSLNVSSVRLDISQKYLDKVQKRAQEQGVSVDELKEKVKKNVGTTLLPEAQRLQAQRLQAQTQVKKEGAKDAKPRIHNERRDNLPVKPLAEIMDIHKILRTPHTPAQISALWTAFHASRSGGTGRGYLSAGVPLKTYETLVEAGRRHPSFIMPLLRESEGGSTPAYEFFFLQWAFHAAPPLPAPSILDAPLPKDAIPPPPELPLATVLFTPLLEYKTRGSFATPHLVLTLYPDLARSHALVLLRGEITPSPTGEGRYLLGQQDAQLLALGLQRFYLLGEDEGEKGKRERRELVRVFNESPGEFEWEELLKHANPTL